MGQVNICMENPLWQHCQWYSWPINWHQRSRSAKFYYWWMVAHCTPKIAEHQSANCPSEIFGGSMNLKMLSGASNVGPKEFIYMCRPLVSEALQVHRVGMTSKLMHRRHSKAHEQLVVMKYPTSCIWSSSSSGRKLMLYECCIVFLRRFFCLELKKCCESSWRNTVSHKNRYTGCHYNTTLPSWTEAFSYGIQQLHQYSLTKKSGNCLWLMTEVCLVC